MDPDKQETRWISRSAKVLLCEPDARRGVVGQPDPQEVIDEDTGLQINAFCLPCFKEMPGLKMIKMKLSFLKALVSSSS